MGGIGKVESMRVREDSGGGEGVSVKLVDHYYRVFH